MNDNIVLSVPDSSGGLGNTILNAPSQCSPAVHWFLTWNNYPKDWESHFNSKSSKIAKYILAKEVGANGTPHIQGNITFVSKTRPKNLFPASIHWEKTLKVSSAVDYCIKGGDYIIKGYDIPYKCKITRLKPWQDELIAILKGEPDERTIYWRWSALGNVGKTTFAKYIFGLFEDVVVLSGKGDDMKNGVISYKNTNKGKLPKIVIIDIPRSLEDFISYNGIEQVKNMFFYSGKYEGGMVCGANPHVLCFSNREPNWDKMSMDRWNVEDLDMAEQNF